MRKWFPLLSAFMVFACAGGSKTTEKEKIIKELEPNEYGVKAVFKSRYKLGEMVIISLENTSDSMAYLFQPNYLTIQRQVDTSWTDLRTIPCPCGAPCAPPGWQPLEPYQEVDYHWDQRETWCDGSIQNPLEQTKTSEVKPGKYRWMIKSNETQDPGSVDHKTLFLEFIIE